MPQWPVCLVSTREVGGSKLLAILFKQMQQTWDRRRKKPKPGVLLRSCHVSGDNSSKNLSQHPRRPMCPPHHLMTQSPLNAMSPPCHPMTQLPHVSTPDTPSTVLPIQLLTSSYRLTRVSFWLVQLDIRMMTCPSSQHDDVMLKSTIVPHGTLVNWNFDLPYLVHMSFVFNETNAVGIMMTRPSWWCQLWPIWWRWIFHLFSHTW